MSFSMRSHEVFRRMLASGMNDIEWKESTTKTIAIKDFPGAVVKAFVDYLYYQELSPPLLDEFSVELGGLADKYQVEVLQRHIVQLRQQFVTHQNVLRLFARTHDSRAADMKEFCLRYMVKHVASIAKQAGSLPPPLLVGFIAAFGK